MAPTRIVTLFLGRSERLLKGDVSNLVFLGRLGGRETGTPDRGNVCKGKIGPNDMSIRLRDRDLS